jgi:hypothetical protein
MRIRPPTECHNEANLLYVNRLYRAGRALESIRLERDLQDNTMWAALKISQL